MDKYSPNVIQNDCLVKIQENESKLTIEFTFNQKYGSDIVDLIFEPILVYNLLNSTSTSNSLDTYELIFDGLTQPINVMRIKLFEI